MKHFLSLFYSFLLIAPICLVAQESNPIQSTLVAMTKEENPRKVSQLVRKTIKQYNLDPNKDVETFNMMYGSMAITYLKKHKFSDFDKNIALISNKFDQTSYLNMAADMLSQIPLNLGKAEELALKTLDLYYTYKDDPSARPEGFDEKSWKRFMDMASAPYHETYAKILHALGKPDAALEQMEIALKGTDIDNHGQTTSALYASILAQQSQEEKAYQILKKAAELGRASDTMISQLRRLHEFLTGYGADQMLDSIKNNIKLAYEKELTKKIIKDKIAPSFNLINLSGGRTSLEENKGKIVVIDFWATWCVPCIQSMPTMDQIRKNNPDVVFLFIATQEKGNDVKDRVESFITKNQYQFQVLLDLPTVDRPGIYPTVKDYEISGIPAKVVIDKDGNIMFSSIGFSNETNLANELQAMIDIAKKPIQNN